MSGATAEVDHTVAVLLRSPESLACLLEAAGAVALERCGAILDAWIDDM